MKSQLLRTVLLTSLLLQGCQGVTSLNFQVQNLEPTIRVNDGRFDKSVYVKRITPSGVVNMMEYKLTPDLSILLQGYITKHSSQIKDVSVTLNSLEMTNKGIRFVEVEPGLCDISSTVAHGGKVIDVNTQFELGIDTVRIKGVGELMVKTCLEKHAAQIVSAINS